MAWDMPIKYTDMKTYFRITIYQQIHYITKVFSSV